jgi:hypothetical protein
MEGFRSVPASRGTLFGLSGRRLLWLGVSLFVVGLVLFLLSAVLPLLAISGFMENPWGSGGPGFGGFGGFGSFASSVMLSFLLSTISFILMGVGAFALWLGLVRPVGGYVATEASPAIRTATTAIGSGLREAGFGGGAPAGTVVRVKCRNCGYLETEDAEFCSKCGQRM